MNSKYKHFFFVIFLTLYTTFGFSQSADTTVVYKFDIKEMIAPAAWRQTMKSVDQAEKIGADYILIHMNTYGGLVDAADSIRTKLINTKIPTLVFIDNNAASAGALISIACDSIYMRPGANIGAATVVSQDGQAMPDKYQSYMRSTMRSTAEHHGKVKRTINGKTKEEWYRDPNIAEAMVDPDVEVEGVSAKGKVLTFTASEAMKYHFCEGTANSIDEVLTNAGIKNYEIVEYKETTIDKIIHFLIHPAVHSVLIMLMLGGIYFELQSPGIGFPIAAAFLGALLYFAPLYIEGIAAHWEIAIFVLGIILIAVEVFAIPGFGVAGISGILLVVVGLTMSMVDNITLFKMGEFNPTPIFKASFVVMLGMLIPFVAVLLSAPKFFESGILRTLVLETTQKSNEGFISTSNETATLVGLIATAATTLRPSGKIECNDDIYDAKSMDSFIEKGEQVRIIKHLHGQLYVRRVDI